MRPRYVLYPLNHNTNIPVVDVPGVFCVGQDLNTCPSVRVTDDTDAMRRFFSMNCHFGGVDLDEELPKEMKGT